jgi:large subunit ribosomal protein L32
MLPAKKTSKTGLVQEEANQALKAVNLSVCKKCSSPKLPHAACSNCGYLNPEDYA